MAGVRGRRQYAGIESVAPIAGPNDPSEPKLGDEVFATNPYYELEREEALYGKAIALDVPPHFFLTGGSGPGYEKFIVQAIQWGNDHGLRTTVLLSPYPWPTNPAGQLETFDEFTNNTFSQDTRDFVGRLRKPMRFPPNGQSTITKTHIPMIIPPWCPKRFSTLRLKSAFGWPGTRQSMPTGIIPKA